MRVLGLLLDYSLWSACCVWKGGTLLDRCSSLSPWLVQCLPQDCDCSKPLVTTCTLAVSKFSSRAFPPAMKPNIDPCLNTPTCTMGTQAGDAAAESAACRAYAECLRQLGDFEGAIESLEAYLKLQEAAHDGVGVGAVGGVCFGGYAFVPPTWIGPPTWSIPTRNWHLQRLCHGKKNCFSMQPCALQLFWSWCACLLYGCSAMTYHL